MSEYLNDVCLLMEGTYPFVYGGVSSWIHNLIKALPHIRFTGVCILPQSDKKWEIKYDLPSNFFDLKIIYLHDYNMENKRKGNRAKRHQQIDLLRIFHKNLHKNNYSFFEKILPIFQSEQKKGLSINDMISGKEAWNLLLELYNPEVNKESFIDFFWTFRFTHLPLFNILKAKIPKAKVYHTISTGYAGLLGSVAKYRYKKPLLLTEHGIYTKERKIEISHADWIYDSSDKRVKINGEIGTFHKMWTNLFHTLGKITYNSADSIFTLYEGNRQIEIAEGADPGKTFVIPNGIDINKFGKIKQNPNRGKEDKKHVYVGFVGRIVSIKDVKTFIRACKIVSLHLPKAFFLIIGPTEEDPVYYEECLELVELLDLQNMVEFTGKVNIMDYYPKLDVLVLTSVSEAQPLVILEAGCVGIPSVASDVGACRELLEGYNEDDKGIGHSGIVTQVADPEDTAKAIITILSDYKLSQKYSIAAKKRVNTFYKESDLNQRYLTIYNKFMKPRSYSENIHSSANLIEPLKTHVQEVV